jgi:hypothetical protein
MSFAEALRHRAEILRAVRNNKFERTADGSVFVPSMKLTIGGVFGAEFNGDGVDIGDNIIPTEGLNHILNTVLDEEAQILAWRVAIFSGNVTPNASYTAANFASTATEITTAYNGTDRPLYVPAPSTTGVTTNTASKADFVFNTSGTARGAAIISGVTKGATTGKLLAVARFASDRAFVAADTLAVTYTLTLSNAA